MSEQSRGFDQWVERIVAGEAVTAGGFARDAIGPLPLIETSVARLSNYRAWGFASQAEMDAAFSQGETQ